MKHKTIPTAGLCLLLSLSFQNAYAQLYPGSNTAITENSANSLLISYPGYNNGHLQITSDGWLNFYTNQSKFFFQKELVLNSGISIYNSNVLNLTFNQGYLQFTTDSWMNFWTDRSAFYFDKPIISNDGSFNTFNGSDLKLQTNGSTRFTISNATGNVGIGIPSPQDNLHVADGSIRIGTDAGDYGQVYYSGGGMGVYNLWASNSAYIRLGAGNVTNNVNIMGDGQVGIGTSSPLNTFQIGPNLNNYVDFDFVVSSQNGNIGLHNNGNEAVFLTSHPIQLKPGGNVAVHADPSGSVGIGTSSLSGPHKLVVKGSTHTREVLVEVTAGADFVFAKDYALTPLEEIEKFVQTNHHLPGIQSEKEMQEEGLKLGEMNILLLQKIEELTLYIIEQNKRLDAQQEEINQLKETNHD